MNGYRPFTQNGYPLDEIISALQKDIRRGNEEQALYWCLEMVPRFEAYLWRRLIVICTPKRLLRKVLLRPIGIDEEFCRPVQVQVMAVFTIDRIRAC